SGSYNSDMNCLLDAYVGRSPLLNLLNQPHKSKNGLGSLIPLPLSIPPISPRRFLYSSFASLIGRSPVATEIIKLFCSSMAVTNLESIAETYHAGRTSQAARFHS